MSFADGDQIARDCVPESDAPIFRDGCKPLAVGTESNRRHAALMSFQILLFRRAGDGPSTVYSVSLSHRVKTYGQQVFSVRAELDSVEYRRLGIGRQQSIGSER